MRDVAGEREDISTFGHDGGQRDTLGELERRGRIERVGTACSGREGGVERSLESIDQRLERVNGHLARLQLELLACPRQIVGPLAVDLERRIGRRELLDLAREVRTDRRHCRERRAMVAYRN